MKINLSEKQLSALMAAQGEVCKLASAQLDYIIATTPLNHPANERLHESTKAINDRIRVLAYQVLKQLNSLAKSES
jgi:hypothetical protein